MTKDSPTSTTEADSNLEKSDQDIYDSPEPDQPATDENNDAPPDIDPYSEPDETPSKEFNQEVLLEFFSKKGTIEILGQLADGPKRFSEINNALTVSHGTVANRLTEGIKLDLWREYIPYPDDGGKIKLYELEEDAEIERLATLATEENINKTTERKRKAYEEHDTALSNVRDQIVSDE